MDPSDLHFNEDPTLPLNEASVLPPNREDHNLWVQYRVHPPMRTTVTPNTEDDGGSEDEDEPLHKGPSMTMNRSLVSSMVDPGRRSGYTMKHVEEELVKLRNENFNLKLRIRLLEERQGLAVMRPEDKENVFRVNLDLQVEKESLKKEISDNKKLLEDAYIALDSLEQDKEQEREIYESRIRELTKESKAKIDREAQKREDILMEAFGSLNLGTHSEDEWIKKQNNLQQDKFDESFGQEVNEKIQHLRAKAEQATELEKLLTEERSEKENLSSQVFELRDNAQKLNAVVADYVSQIKSIKAEGDKTKAELENALAEKCREVSGLAKNAEENALACEELQHALDEKISEIAELQENARRLETDLNLGDEAHKESQAHAIMTIAGLRQEMEALKSSARNRDSDARRLNDQIDRLLSENEELRSHIQVSESQMKDKISKFESEISARDIELEKTRSCVTGLAEIDMEQKEEIKKLERDLKKRNLALDKLKEEYEIVKAKVRRYRAEKSSFENKENIQNNRNNTEKRQSDVDPHRTAKIAMLEKEMSRLREELQIKSSKEVGQGDNGDIVEAVRREVKKLKKSFVRSGAERAADKAEQIFSVELKKLETTHNCVINLMRRRLEELADFLETLLSSGALDLSFLPLQARESFQRSLNESRRLSHSFAANQSHQAFGNQSLGLGNQSLLENISELRDPNLTQTLNEEVMPEFKLPVISIKLSDEDLDFDEDDVDVDNLTATIITGCQEKVILQNRIESLQKQVEDVDRLHKLAEELTRENRQHLADVQTREARVVDLEAALQKVDCDLIKYKSKFAETSSILDDLRIKHGQLKEKLREKTNQVEIAEEKLRQKGESHKEVGRLKNEIVKLQMRNEELQVQIRKIESESKSELERLLMERDSDDSELERLRQELKDANAKLAEYRERQERLERAIRPQLAKTHQVLKKTQVILDRNSTS